MRERHRTDELMDDPAISAAEHDHALAGLARLNAWSRSHRLLWPMIERNARAANAAGRTLHVIDVAKKLLDKYTPLRDAAHGSTSSYAVVDGQLVPPLLDPRAFVGYTGPASSPTSILLQHNDLHIMVLIDRSSRFGRTDPAGVSDILVESSITR
jgi:hypothetical protein